MNPTVKYFKKRLEHISLSKRLVLFLSVPLTSLFIVSATFDYKLASETINSAYDATLTDVITDLESLIRYSKNSSQISLSPEIENLIESASPDSVYFAIRDKHGNLIEGHPDVPIFNSKSNGMSFKNSVWKDASVRIATHHINIKGIDFYIVVMETTIRRTKALNDFLTATLAPNLIFTLMALLCVWYAVRIGLAPLQGLESQLSEKNQNDLALLITEGYPPEILPIVERLNDLLIRLDKSQSSQRRFLADAAHQLRTPLTCLQTNIEIYVAENSKNEPSERLRNVFTSIERMSHLVSQLLAFARTEDAFQKVEKQPVDLAKVIENVASELIDSAIQKNIDMSFELDHVMVDGVAWLLHEGIANLLDNAIRYTPEKGSVCIRCQLSDGHPTLEISDTGPSIDPAYRELVFERFFRVPGTTGDGCGLGLSVVQQICAQHSATLSLSDNQPTGLNVRIEFQ